MTQKPLPSTLFESLDDPSLSPIPVDPRLQPSTVSDLLVSDDDPSQPIVPTTIPTSSIPTSSIPASSIPASSIPTIPPTIPPSAQVTLPPSAQATLYPMAGGLQPNYEAMVGAQRIDEQREIQAQEELEEQAKQQRARMFRRVGRITAWLAASAVLILALISATYVFESEIRTLVKSPRFSNLAAAVGIGPNWRVNCSMSVASTPRGARVYIDGRFVGVTPVVADLNVGDRGAANVRIESDDYWLWERRTACPNYATVNAQLVPKQLKKARRR